MPRSRPIAVSAALVLFAVGGCDARSGQGGPTSGPGTARAEAVVGSTVEARPVEPRALRVLHAWDARRARAYSRADVGALRRLYVPGSRAGVRDVRALGEYGGRGLAVRGLRMQVLAVQVLTAAPERLRLRVRDRVASGRVVGPTRASLPRDRPGTHTVVLVRVRSGWVVRAVHPVRLGALGTLTVSAAPRRPGR